MSCKSFFISIPASPGPARHPFFSRPTKKPFSLILYHSRVGLDKDFFEFYKYDSRIKGDSFHIVLSQKQILNLHRTNCMLNNECKVYVRATGEGEKVDFRFDCGEGSRYVLWSLKQHPEKMTDRDKLSMKMGQKIPRDAELEIVRFGSKKFRDTMNEMIGEFMLLIIGAHQVTPPHCQASHPSRVISTLMAMQAQFECVTTKKPFCITPKSTVSFSFTFTLCTSSLRRDAHHQDPSQPDRVPRQGRRHHRH